MDPSALLAQAKFNLSEKAAYNSVQDLPWDSLEKLMANIWSLDNPEGLVSLGVAENSFVHQEVARYIKNHSSVISNNHHMGYGVGPRGSPRLKKALASFLSSEFRASEAVTEKELLVMPGVVSVLDALTWSICNENEGILTPVPFYTGFKPATSTRARGVLLSASFQCLEGYQGLDDIFDPEMNKNALENALLRATQDGVKVRAVFITNPHNPLGRCYPVETLRAIARFCGSNNLHLISDEVFALSVYDNPQAPKVAPFTSVLAANLHGCIDRHLVHVAYGMGKDFGATGLRLGVLHSRNEGLIAAVSSISVFGWVPYLSQDMWADILEDEQFLFDFRTRNREVLAKHSTLLRSLLEQYNIPYYANVHAGVFIWVDLRQYLPEELIDEALSREQESVSPVVDANRDREMKLLKRCMAEGVGISLGSSFATEELGWYRISFAIEEQALNVGIQRLSRCFESIKTNGWNTE